MERDKTGEIAFLPLSSHLFFVPLSFCIYLVLPWDSATIDAYRIHRQGITWQDGEFRWCTLFGSNNWTYVLEINWPGDTRAMTKASPRTLGPKECRGSWLSTYYSRQRFICILICVAWTERRDAMHFVAIQQKKLLLYRVERGNILFMSGYKGCWCTLLFALKISLKEFSLFFSSINFIA
jgi:hypothetical protein